MISNISSAPKNSPLGDYLSDLLAGKLIRNLKITHVQKKMIFQTFTIMFHVNLPGCTSWPTWSSPSSKVNLWCKNLKPLEGQLASTKPYKIIAMEQWKWNRHLKVALGIFISLGIYVHLLRWTALIFPSSVSSWIHITSCRPWVISCSA